MKKTGLNIVVLFTVFFSIYYTFNNILNINLKYYFILLSVFYIILLIINNELKKRNIIKDNQVFIPVFANTFILVIISLICMFINHEKSVFNLIAIPVCILGAGTTYYLLKIMQPWNKLQLIT